jgi:hypothetical protein
MTRSPTGHSEKADVTLQITDSSVIRNRGKRPLFVTGNSRRKVTNHGKNEKKKEITRDYVAGMRVMLWLGSRSPGRLGRGHVSQISAAYEKNI